MAKLRRDSALGAGDEPREPDHEVAAAVDAYLKLTGGDVRQALAVSVADGIAVSKLMSTGYARWRQPSRARGG
jgi:hypothetical protein